MKVEKSPSMLFYPCPVVLVTSVDEKGEPNIVTLAWVGVACSDPPTISIAIRPSRHSYGLIERSREFVVNIPTLSILKQTEHCGRVSGREHKKFEETGLTPEPASKVKPPLIKECPVNLECTLRQIVKLGSHSLFLGQIVTVHAEQEMLDADGHIDYSKAQPFVYNQGEYWNLGRKLES